MTITEFGKRVNELHDQIAALAEQAAELDATAEREHNQFHEYITSVGIALTEARTTLACCGIYIRHMPKYEPAADKIKFREWL